MNTPHVRLASAGVEVPKSSAGDPRVGQLLAPVCDGSTRVVLIGFPSDEGVRRNGGRVGSAAGPSAIRRALYRLTPDARCWPEHRDLLAACCDLGDLVVTGDVSKDQEALGRLVGEHLEAGHKVVVLGGGHETAFGHFLGYVSAGRAAEILNVDAHADVREIGEAGPHSGSPFRQAIEHPSGLCRGYTVAGLQPQSAAKVHLDYLTAHACRHLWWEAVAAGDVAAQFDSAPGAKPDGALMVTLDLDAVEASAAPGVSAPTPRGLGADLFLEYAKQAGRCPRVESLDISELNPAFDIDGRTARLAALAVWEFTRGLVDR